MELRLAARVPMLLGVLLACIWPVFSDGLAAPSEDNKLQSASRSAISIPSESLVASACETRGKDEITITCHYRSAEHSASNSVAEPQIVLHRAVISFKTRDESRMLVELTMTNGDKVPFSNARTVYLVIDDDTGQNYVRRALPHVDFRKLAPGAKLTFSERLLIAPFPPGHYTVQLWIPDPDDSVKFNPTHNLLLRNVGVANRATGLNLLATFTTTH